MNGASRSTDAAALLAHGRDLRGRQESEAAYEAIAGAARLAPDDPVIALANARIRFETWRPAVDHAERALAANPGTPDAIALLASALAAEGRPDEADDLLSRTLHGRPAWLDGHRQLIHLRTTRGEIDGVDRTIEGACAAQPGNPSLRLAWFQALVARRDWPGARRLAADGDSLRLARLFLASESDEASRDPHLFDGVAHVQDVGLDVARVRFHLRIGQPERAAAIAGQHIGGPAARAFWPYLSLAWRLSGDDRAIWLDRDDAFVTVTDLALPASLLAALARALRGLLTMAAPFPEQSVRGGIQTDRQLFFHPDPAIQRARRAVTEAVRNHARALPPPDGPHPLLGQRPGQPLFAGSWAVLLRSHGHHSPHTHSHGWLSSALHIDLPDAAPTDGATPGWISFGTPPPELGLGLDATRSIEPKAGSLVLFPSTTWHRTDPFTRGDRLTVAFDIQPAQGGIRP